MVEKTEIYVACQCFNKYQFIGEFVIDGCNLLSICMSMRVIYYLSFPLFIHVLFLRNLFSALKEFNIIK
jgi:hypothetical protein